MIESNNEMWNLETSKVAINSLSIASIRTRSPGDWVSNQVVDYQSFIMIDMIHYQYDCECDRRMTSTSWISKLVTHL